MALGTTGTSIVMSMPSTLTDDVGGAITNDAASTLTYDGGMVVAMSDGAASTIETRMAIDFANRPILQLKIAKRRLEL